jgi:hypothetical protein
MRIYVASSNENYLQSDAIQAKHVREKSDLSIGYKCLDTQIEFPYILKHRNNNYQKIKNMKFFGSSFIRMRMRNCHTFRGQSVKSMIKGD